mmetsp:Transcript_9155/g.23993  ORF Transcript_9155/g.23993 Transcript_9155/m.23993 type:complete len:206 (-) Transcript_9155:117-734(-)
MSASPRTRSSWIRVAAWRMPLTMSSSSCDVARRRRHQRCRGCASRRVIACSATWGLRASRPVLSSSATSRNSHRPAPRRGRHQRQCRTRSSSTMAQWSLHRPTPTTSSDQSRLWQSQLRPSRVQPRRDDTHAELFRSLFAIGPSAPSSGASQVRNAERKYAARLEATTDCVALAKWQSSASRVGKKPSEQCRKYAPRIVPRVSTN